MTATALVLGAKGRFGRAAVDALAQAGWTVKALARNWDGAPAADAGVVRLTGDGFDAATLRRAAEGCDVIVNALNPPYHKWADDLPRFTANVIAAARATGAHIALPGNVYNYGAAMPALLTEATPHRPTTRKGRLREEMENAYRAAASNGVRTLILRGGDFMERAETGNWFDSHIANRVGEGRVMYPGPLDRVHAWAYLPDMARAMVALLARRDELAPFEDVGFAGYGLTGRELIDAMERVSGRKLKVRGMPWLLVRLAGLVSAPMREVVEMAYLWRVPHAVDGARMAELVPGFQATPLDVALADCLSVTAPVAEPEPRLGPATQIAGGSRA